jgi:sodium transport system permease protein
MKRSDPEKVGPGPTSAAGGAVARRGAGLGLAAAAAAAWTVFRKEWIDAMRDRRTLFVVLLSSVALGPVLLVLLSLLVSNLEQRAEQRELLVVAAAQAPSFVNHAQRQGYTVTDAPSAYEQQIRAQQLLDAVVVIPEGFEADLQAGRQPVVRVVSRSADQRSQASADRARRLLASFNQEQAQARLAWRGVAPGLLAVVEVEDRDLADPAAQAMRFTSMLPFFVLMAMLYGALTAALDATAGERERGSLEPLLMNPASGWSIVVGKWGAVTAVALLIAVLSAFSFLPGQWFLRNETLAALFRFDVPEALRFVGVLAPLGGAMAAVLMAVAIRCRSFKEAQANSSVVLLLASLLPLVSVFNQGAEVPWHLHVPVLAQVTLMNRVLRGEPLGVGDALMASSVALVVTVVALALVVRQLRGAALAAR